MNTDVIERLQNQVPEFRADPLFRDLPYVAVGEFAQFLIRCIRSTPENDDVIDRSFRVLNALYLDRANTDLIEVAVFEPMADDPAASEIAFKRLSDSAREAFAHYVSK